MKRVVSVSLGSSSRDKSQDTEFFGEQFHIERVGVDGSFARYIAKLEELDGNVDAIGIGGLDAYLWANGRRYAFREAKALVSHIKKTPWVDGSGLKNTLERETVRRLQNSGTVDFRGKKVLMVAGVDRFGMAEALHEAGADLAMGDLMFAVGLPIAITRWAQFQFLAKLLLPIIVQAPFKLLYPTGEKQDAITPKYLKWYDWADVIAGDFLLIRRYMPDHLDGKVILTNTTRKADRDQLKARGVSTLITTTPNFGGESFGTNVMEGVLVTAAGKRPEEMSPEKYMDMLDRLDWAPNVDDLSGGA
jgi:hypothetical protein